MGIHDREYYRDEVRAEGFRMGQPRSIVVWLIIINVVIYVIGMFVGDLEPPAVAERAGPNFHYTLMDAMAIRSDLFQHPWNAWQLLTAGFAHAPLHVTGGVMHILMNMYALFLFGRDVENKYGRYEFLWLYMIALVFSNFAWVGLQQIFGNTEPLLAINGFTIYPGALGASGAVTAVVILFCLNFPRRTLLLMGIAPIPAWAVGVAFIGIDLSRALFQASGHKGDNVAWEAHLAGALFALIYFRFPVRFTRILPGRFRGTGWLKSKPKLRVHSAEPEETYQDLDREADRVLDKLHREGEESLTPRERQVLEAYSRRMRQKHR